MEGAVVEDAEEEDEVEGAVPTELLGVPQVAEHPRVRCRELPLPLLVEPAILFEVGEREEDRLQVLVDPARVDAVLRARPRASGAPPSPVRRRRPRAPRP